MHYLNPQLDVVFKMLFVRNQELLRHMLEAVLGQDIEVLEILNPAIAADLARDKDVEFDIRVQLRSRERIDVEMQVDIRDCLPSRLVFYSARDYASQLRSGEPYDNLTPTIVIAWLAKRLFPDLEAFHSVFELRERATHRQYSDDLAIHILQLSEIHRTSPQLGASYSKRAELWGRFLVARDESEFKALAQENSTMASAVDALQHLSQDPEAIRLAQERLDAVRLRQIEIAQSRRKAIAEGRAEGKVATLRDNIVRVCKTFDIKLTDERQAKLNASAEELQVLFDRLLENQRWPD